MKIFFRTLIALSLTSFAWADSITILGVDFPVERITHSEDSTVIVTLNGESRLIPKSALDEFVIKGVFSKAFREKLSLSGSQLEKFMIEALNNKNYEWVATSLASYCDEGFAQAGKKGFIQGLYAREKDIFIKINQYFEKSINIIHFDSECSEFLYKAGINHPEQVKNGYLKLLYKIAPTIKELYKQGFAQSIISDEESSKLLNSYKVLYGDTDPLVTYFTKRKLLISSITENVTHKRWLNLKNDIDTTGPEEKVVISQFLSNKASDLCSKELLIDCISLLSCIPDEGFRSDIPSMIKKALTEKISLENEIFIRKDLLKFLVKVSLKSPEVKNEFEDMLESKLERSSEVFNFELLSILHELSPAKARSHGVLIAKKLYAINQTEDAKKIINNFVPQLSFLEKLSLHASRLFNSLFFLLSVAGVILTTLGCIRFGKASKKQIDKSGNATTSGAYQPPPRFVSEIKLNLDTPRRIEINTCLHYFGLSENASEKEIKNAYRKRIKDVHPDAMGGSQNAEANAEFLKTQEMYERLTELLKQNN